MTLKQTLSKTPQNTNFLYSTKYTMHIPGLPVTTFFLQSVTFPSINLGEVLQDSPFSTIYRHSDKLVYDPLTVTFLVDEDLRNWEEVYKWMQALTAPQKFSQYGKNSGHFLYHDTSLTFNKNSNISNIRFTFKDCHPISLGAIQMDETLDPSLPIVCDMTLRYNYLEYSRI